MRRHNIRGRLKGKVKHVKGTLRRMAPKHNGTPEGDQVQPSRPLVAAAIFSYSLISRWLDRAARPRAYNERVTRRSGSGLLLSRSLFPAAVTSLAFGAASTARASLSRPS